MSYPVKSTKTLPHQHHLHACQNCGAEIDIIFDKCIFCQTPLPAIDYQRLSNEEIIANAGEWIGKSKGEQLIIPNPHYNGEDSNASPTIILPINIAIGNADKYLNILNYRALSNPELLPVYRSLSAQQRKRGQISTNASNSVLAVAFCVTIIVVYCGIFGAINYETKMTNKALINETARLETIMNQVDQAMIEKDYSKAEYLAAKIDWQLDDRKQKESWKHTRLRIIDTIGVMKTRKKQHGKSDEGAW